MHGMDLCMLTMIEDPPCIVFNYAVQSAPRASIVYLVQFLLTLRLWQSLLAIQLLSFAANIFPHISWWTY